MPLLALMLLCAGYLTAASRSSGSTSITFDETFFLGTALQSAHDHRIDPRLVAAGVAPLPILLSYLPVTLSGQGEIRENLWQGQASDAQRIAAPRRMTAWLFGLPLITTVFVVLYRRRGFTAALLGGGLIAASPTILAHGALATTDLCFGLAMLLALLAAAREFDRHTRERLIVWGAATGLAISAKYSGLCLLPAAGLLMALQVYWDERDRPPANRRWGRWLRVTFLRYAVFLALTGIACWMGHLLQTAGPLKAVSFDDTASYSPWFKLLGRGPTAKAVMTIAHEWIPRPAPLEGIAFQLQHSGWGHPAYLMGQFSKYGWWYFFPCAFAFKSTPAEFGLLLVVAAFGIRWLPRIRSITQRPDALTTCAAMIGFVFVAFLMTAKINLGQRYALPLYPFVILVGVDGLARALANRRGLHAVVASLLLACQISSSAAVAPDFLTYFNDASGGPSRGRRLLVDSSLDWGQGLPRLRAFQERHPEPLALKYFGTAVPEAYGVHATNLDELPNGLDRIRWFAISATYLQGDYTREVDPFSTLRQFEPTDRASESILIFDLEAEGRRDAFQAAFARLPEAFSPGEQPRWKSWAE